MILTRVEITLTGPDEYPEGLDEFHGFEFDEIDARNLLENMLLHLQAELERSLPREFKLEILGLTRSGASAPSGAPGTSQRRR